MKIRLALLNDDGTQITENTLRIPPQIMSVTDPAIDRRQDRLMDAVQRAVVELLLRAAALGQRP